MSVVMYTQIWMGGVIAFGVVFYVVAMRYAKLCDTLTDEE